MSELSNYNASSVSCTFDEVEQGPTWTIRLVDENSKGLKINPTPVLQVENLQLDVRVLKSLIDLWEKKMGVIK